MGSVFSAKNAVNAQIKTMDERAVAMQGAIKSLADSLQNAQNVFKETEQDVLESIASNLDSSKKKFEDAVSKIRQSQTELKKCLNML